MYCLVSITNFRYRFFGKILPLIQQYIKHYVQLPCFNIRDFERLFLFAEN